MPFRADLVGGDKDPFNLRWDHGDFLQGTLLRQFLNEFGAVKTLYLGDLTE